LPWVKEHRFQYAKEIHPPRRRDGARNEGRQFACRRIGDGAQGGKGDAMLARESRHDMGFQVDGISAGGAKQIRLGGGAENNPLRTGHGRDDRIRQARRQALCPERIGGDVLALAHDFGGDHAVA